MRKITKQGEPEALTKWVRANPKGRYKDLPGELRQEIRKACLEEQHGLCAYCCQSISVEKSHNEHVVAQDNDPNRTLDFTNIVASCNDPKQCGIFHKTSLLPLTPLMQECENEFKFYLSVELKGKLIALLQQYKR